MNTEVAKPANNAIHQSRIRIHVIYIPVSLRPGDGRRSQLRVTLSSTSIDENRRPFSICVVCEGQKGIITYDSRSALRRERYTSKVVEATEVEYGYILDNYLDYRKWS